MISAKSLEFHIVPGSYLVAGSLMVAATSQERQIFHALKAAASEHAPVHEETT